jgi:DNA polymerase-3 subunit epsilon
MSYLFRYPGKYAGPTFRALKMDQDPNEDIAHQLEGTGNYRVLRRVDPGALAKLGSGDGRLGICIDLETTGLDPTQDEIIEIGMVPFTYTADGRIIDIKKPFSGLRQPSKPIPAEVTEITGITNEMVAGKMIEPAEVAAFAAPAALIVAHNAGFDRKFAERFCDVFTTKPWACSMSQVPWQQEGFEGTRLGYLLAGFGLFNEAHRAIDDCYSALAILARPLPRSGESALSRLLAAARKPTCRIWAENSPFELKDALKKRGYRWNGDSNGRPRAWYADVIEEHAEAELKFLKDEIYQRDVELRVQKIAAYDRFSERG